MKWGQILLGVFIGGIAAHIWHRKDWNTNSKKDEVKITEVANDVIQEESSKFSNVLKKQYDIVMPSDQISKKVRKKAEELTKGRRAIFANRVKKPVEI